MLAAPGVRGLQPYVPGKPIAELERELGISGSIKLASNENPLGPPAASLRAIEAELPQLALYPDGSGFELKKALASRLGVDPAWLTLGNGSNELLVLLAEVFLAPGRSAVIAEHAFLVYLLAVQATSARAFVVPALPATHTKQPLGHDLDAMRARIDDSTRLVYIANPNNPTGSCIGGLELHDFMDSVPDNVIVVVDEAYAEYVVDPAWSSAVGWVQAFPNLVVTRTFSKIYGLAGLRVGYAVCQGVIADLLNRVRQPFNVNSLGQAAALAALDADDHVQRSRQVNVSGRRQLADGLQQMGCTVLPSEGNFVLAKIPGSAAACYEGLLRAGVIVRPVANYGLPDYLRITVGLASQNQRLLDSMALLLNGVSPPARGAPA
jgi:histidinol-phosphate aminotransferase